MHHVSDEKRQAALENVIMEGVQEMFGYAIQEVEGAEQRGILTASILTFIEGMLCTFRAKGDIVGGGVHNVKLEDRNARVHVRATWPFNDISFTIPGVDRNLPQDG